MLYIVKQVLNNRLYQNIYATLDYKSGALLTLLRLYKVLIISEVLLKRP